MLHELNQSDNELLDMARKAIEYERLLQVIQEHYYDKYKVVIDVPNAIAIGIYGDKNNLIYKAKPHERLSDLLQWLFEHEDELT